MSVIKKRKLKLGWKKILVSEVDSDFFDGITGEQCRGNWGEAMESGLFITLDGRQQKKEKAETLLHEIIHIISDYGGLDLTEGQVTVISNLQSQVFQENRWLRDFIWSPGR
jgi:hypothetical protein